MIARKLCLLLVVSIFLLCSQAVSSPKSGPPAALISEGYVTTSDGIRIHYLESGDAASPRALVLITGWRLPAYLWNEQLEKFSHDMRVLAIDPRSEGESTKTPDGNTPEFRARDLHDVLAQLKISEYVLVGWSQGVQDLAAYIQQFGMDPIAGVVIVDSPVFAGPAEIELHKESSESTLSRMTLFVNYPRESMHGMVHSFFLQPHPDLDMEKIVNTTLQTPTATAIAMLVSDYFGVDRRPALTKINKPTLIIAPAASPYFEREREMAAKIRGAQFLVVEGSGHAVMIDQQKKFDNALEGFLQSRVTW
ncbi:MAG TPA: alpha/beta hydrolase [Terriglobales bacterium]|nr:alpha/beta hydrolase [Terriglobales bacterium]